MMTLDKTIQEKKKCLLANGLVTKYAVIVMLIKELSKDEYGIDIIYINISKTAVLIIYQ